MIGKKRWRRRRKEFTIVLSADDEVRVRFEREDKQVVEFAVQYLARIKGKWRPIVRFDTAHGRPHMDISHPDGTQETRTFDFYSYGTALTYAIRDVQQRWEFYRERYERELGDDSRRAIQEKQ